MVKITPPVPFGVLPRKRLFDLIDDKRKKPVVWIAGPAGFGKTTLVASYLKERETPCLWYQVDEGDADISTFFYFMGLAAKKAAPRMRKSLPLLTPEYLQGVPTFTRRYFEELFSSLAPKVPPPLSLPRQGNKKENPLLARGGVVLVIDNYQDVPVDSGFHDVIMHCIEVVPKGTNIIVLSRSGPPGQLARLRANNKISFVGRKEIGFTMEECSYFLKTKGKILPDETVRQLHNKTDGWAAGLVLITEMAKTEEIPYSLLNELSQEAVFHYFVNEIFEKTDSDTRDFLLKTSFFPSITAAAAEKLTGNAGAHAILSRLSRSNYFTDWRSLPSPVYQYHPLFRDFLQACAKSAFNREQLTDIRGRTAKILETEGRIKDAVTLYSDAEDWQGLSAIIIGHAQTLLTHGRHQSLQKWIGLIPEEITETFPWLQYWLGICKMPFDPAESRQLLERAFERFKSAGDAAGTFLSWAGVADTFVYELGDFSSADRWISEIEILQRQYPKFPAYEIEAHVAFATFCLMIFRQPQHADLPRWVEKVRKIALGTTDIRFKILITAHLTLYYTWWTGEQAKAALLIETVGPTVQPANIDPFTHIIWRAFEAAHHWMTAENEACLSSVKIGLQTAESSGIHIWDFVLLAQATWAMTSATPGAIGKHLRSMEFVTITNRRIDISYYHYLLGWEAICLGNLTRAEEHMRTAVRLVKETGIAAPFGLAFTLMGLAEVLIESARFSEAERHLANARQLGLEMTSKTVEYQYSWVHALLCLKRGDNRGALDSIRHHLSIGREYGISNHPCWRSAVMVLLYAKALEAGIEVDHVRHLIRKHHLTPEISLELEEWPYPVKIYTLGTFRILKNDEPVVFEGKVQHKPLKMLKALIALGGKDVPEERLIDLLWPDAEGDQGHLSHQSTLLRLRKLLGKDNAVQLTGRTVSIDPRYCWVDVWEMERVMDRALELWKTIPDDRSATAEERAVILTEKALKMYKGPFLPGDGEEAWTASLREKLRSRQLRLLESLGQHWKNAGQWDKALTYFQLGLEIDNLAEEFYRDLMLCYEKLGRKAEAVRVYKQCSSIFASILDLGPSEATEALYRRIVGKR